MNHQETLQLAIACVEALHDRPRTIRELSEQTAAAEPPILNLLQCLADAGLVRWANDHTVTLTEKAETLSSFEWLQAVWRRLALRENLRLLTSADRRVAAVTLALARKAAPAGASEICFG